MDNSILIDIELVLFNYSKSLIPFTVFHTKYTGKTLDSMTAGFGTVRGRATNVFLASAGYRDVSGSAKLTRSELTQFNAKLRKAKAEGKLPKEFASVVKMKKSAMTMKKAAMKLKKESAMKLKKSGMMMKKAAVMMKKAAGMKMKKK